MENIKNIKEITPDEYLNLIVEHLKDKNGNIDGSFTGLLNIIYEQFSTYYAAKETIKNEGMVLTTSTGKTYANPLLKVESDAIKNVYKAIGELGISPSQILKNDKLKSSIKCDDDEDDDVLKELLNE